MDLIYLTDPICCCESECGPRQPIACSATIARSYLLSYHPQMLFHTHHTQLFWNDPFQKRSFLFHTEYFRMRFIDSLSIVRIHFHSKYLFQSWECLKRACNANDRRMWHQKQWIGKVFFIPIVLPQNSALSKSCHCPCLRQMFELIYTISTAAQNAFQFDDSRYATLKFYSLPPVANTRFAMQSREMHYCTRFCSAVEYLNNLTHQTIIEASIPLNTILVLHSPEETLLTLTMLPKHENENPFLASRSSKVRCNRSWMTMILSVDSSWTKCDTDSTSSTTEEGLTCFACFPLPSPRLFWIFLNKTNWLDGKSRRFSPPQANLGIRHSNEKRNRTLFSEFSTCTFFPNFSSRPWEETLSKRERHATTIQKTVSPQVKSLSLLHVVRSLRARENESLWFIKKIEESFSYEKYARRRQQHVKRRRK